MNKKTLLILSVCLALTLGSSPAFANDDIKIGVAGPLTGNLANLGISSLHGVKVVADICNAKGGILGKKITIIAEDDQCMPKLATTVAEKLVANKVDVIVGHICSGATSAAMPAYNTAKIISMSPAATTPSLTLTGKNPYFFRTIANDNTQAKLTSSFVTGTLQAKNIAIVHDGSAYGKGFAETNKVLIEKNNAQKVQFFKTIAPNANDYTPIIKILKDKKIDAIIFGGYHPTASTLIQQMAQEGMHIPFLGPDSLKNANFIQMLGENTKNVYVSSPSETRTLKISKKAYKEHVDMFGTEPGVFYYTAYAATQALLQAMEKAQSTDIDKVIHILQTQTVDTPAGNITFSATGDAIGVALSIYQIKKNDFVETKHKITIE